MAYSDPSVRSKVPASRRMNHDANCGEQESPVVNGLDGDLLDLIRNVLDKVLRNQRQLDRMERKIENVQDQIIELNGKMDIFTTQVLVGRNLQGNESGSDRNAVSSGTDFETKHKRSSHDFEMEENYDSTQRSVPTSENNSVPSSMDFHERISMHNEQGREVDQVSRIEETELKTTSSTVVVNTKHDSNASETDTEQQKQNGHHAAPPHEPSQVRMESVMTSGLGAIDKNTAEVKNEVESFKSDNSGSQREAAPRRTGMNFGRGELQKRPQSPVPLTPWKSNVPDSQFKKTMTNSSDDNRRTYLGVSVVDKALSEGTNIDDGPAAMTVDDDHDTLSLESDKQLLNNQITAPSGFKNEHGDDDNRFLSSAHEDLKHSLYTHRSQSLSNLQVLKEGHRRADGDGAPAPEQKVEKMSEQTSDVVPDEVLHALIETERLAAKECDDVKSEMLDTVICLDTSDSMSGKPIQHAIKIIKVLLEDLEKNSMNHELEENVALVTFGKENKILCHLTNDYGAIRDKLDTITTGGPSSLWLGLALALTEIKERGGSCIMNSLTVLPRIILITDGFATQKNQLTGTDITTVDASTSTEVLSLYQMCYVICSCVDCIVVGSCNEDLLKVLSNNRVFRPQDTKYLTEFFVVRDLANQYLEKIAAGELRKTFIETLVENTKLTAEGKRDMLHVLQENISKSEGSSSEETQAVATESEENTGEEKEQDEQQAESETKPLVEPPAQTQPEPQPEPQSEKPTEKPPITPRSKPRSEPQLETTVQEQPESMQPVTLESQTSVVDELDESRIPTFGSVVLANQEWEGYPTRQKLVGTVVGQRKNGYLKVLWSDGTMDRCRFGVNGLYDVQVTEVDQGDEGDDSLRVGSLVERGNDWRWKDQDGGVGNIGVVMKIEGAVLHVIWPHGGQGNYRYGYNKKYDLKLCPRTKAKTEPPMRYFAWYIQDLSKNWHLLPKDVNDSMEQMYSTKENGTFLVSMSTKQFRISFQNMSASDVETKNPYPIERREITKEEWQKLNEQ